MPTYRLSDMTWEDVRSLDPARSVALLPIGATEAHGPHLPLSTDVIISEAMVEDAAVRLAELGHLPIQFPPLAYTAAKFAEAFPGTISVRPEVVTDLIIDIARSAAKVGIGVLGLANSHLDPVHLGSLQAAVDIIERENILRVAYPNITRKPWALELTDEFKTGACHAGQFEGSIVMSARRDLVREDIQASLPDNPSSLSTAIRSGKTSFEDAGGPEAYFGFPSQATAEEGAATIATLGRLLAECVVQEFAKQEASES